MKLLLFENDEIVARTLRVNLNLRGYDVQWMKHDDDAFSYIRSVRPQVAVVSSEAPHHRGLELVRRVRAHGFHLPIVLLTSVDNVLERVRSLEAGADDLLQKPIHIDELAAHLSALLRRCRREGDQEGKLTVGLLRLDAAGGMFYVGGQIVRFSRRERALLKALIQQPSQVVDRDELFSQVFPAGPESVKPKALDVVVYRLRKKLIGSDVAIVTFGSTGYALQAMD